MWKFSTLLIVSILTATSVCAEDPGGDEHCSSAHLGMACTSDSDCGCEQLYCKSDPFSDTGGGCRAISYEAQLRANRVKLSFATLDDRIGGVFDCDAGCNGARGGSSGVTECLASHGCDSAPTRTHLDTIDTADRTFDCCLDCDDVRGGRSGMTECLLEHGCPEGSDLEDACSSNPIDLLTDTGDGSRRALRRV